LKIVPKPTRVSDHDGSPESARRLHTLSASGAAEETVPKRSRRAFSAAEKLRIVREAEACLASGKRGALEAMLRREGLYSSQLASWRMQLGAQGTAGLKTRKPGRKPKLDAKDHRIAELSKRNTELERKLYIAGKLIELQKKAHEILGIALPESDGES
jgi:transposase-like protein